MAKKPRAAQPHRPLARTSEPVFAWPGTGTAAAIFFGLALVYFLPAFLPGRHIYGTDYFGGGYFFYHFISERLAAGSLPKWVPYIFGGLPLFANPGSTYQPAHFIADVLLPISRVLPAVFVVHFGLAGVGMYLLARELECRPWVAFIAGLSFQFTGILLSWVYAGHDGRIIVATVAPLFFYFLHRGIRTAALPPFVGASATLALALLSFQIQNSYYLLLASAIWAVFCIVHLGVFHRRAELGKVVALGLGSVAFAFLLSAVNFLPFQGYVPESPRGMEGGRGYEYSTSFSMPVSELLSLAVPEQAGVSVGDPNTGERLFPEYRGANPFKLHTEYVGALVILMLALGILVVRRNRYWLFFLALAAFMTSIALGGNTPLYRLYYEILPGTKQFRAPSLAFFVTAHCLVVMAALTLERIAQLREEVARGTRESGPAELLARLPLVVAGLVALLFLGMALAGAGPAEAGVALGWGRFAFVVAITGGLLWLWSTGKMRTIALVALLALITVGDLWSVGRRFFHTAPPADVTFAPDDVMLFLLRQPQPVRMWTFPFPEHYRGAGSYGGNYPMLFGIQQIGGEHPNHLQRWNEYVGAGTQTYIDWHNLIADASVVMHPDGYQAIAFQERPGFLNAANVRYVVSMAPLMHPSLREVHRGSALVYENTAALPRAYLVPEARTVGEGGMLGAMLQGEWDPRQTAFIEGGAGVNLPPGELESSAEVLEYHPDRVVVRTRADRAALLVLADNYYPDWRASVNGREVPVIRTNHTFRGVPVPAGEHEVVFQFRPTTFYVGLYIYVAGTLLLAAYGLFLLLLRWREKRSSGGGEVPADAR